MSVLVAQKVFDFDCLITQACEVVTFQFENIFYQRGLQRDTYYNERVYSPTSFNMKLLRICSINILTRNFQMKIS